MKKILVTGGRGFIGSHFVEQALIKGHFIIDIDKMNYASHRVLPWDNHPKYTFLKADISEIDHIPTCDILINFAAESHVDNSIKDGRPFVRTNVEGTFNLLEVARQNPNLKKFIQISTDEVYGDMDDYGPGVLADEEFSLIGSSYYSSTKASADLLVQAAGRTYGLPYLITRTCNNYGENQHQEKLLPTIINCIKNNLKIPIYGDGQNVREWIHADDNSMIIFNLLNSNSTGILNIGSGERYTNLQII